MKKFIPHELIVLFRQYKRVRDLIKMFFAQMLGFIHEAENGLWLFGNSMGYRDNSRYFFEFVNSKTTINAIWVTSNSREFHSIKSRGFKVVKKGTIDLFTFLIKCEVAIVCTGLGDVSSLLSKKTLVVNLFHGIPLKKIGLDVVGEKSFFERRLLKVLLGRFDIVCSASKVCQERFKTSFGKTAEYLPISGQPRTDLFFPGSVSHKSLATENKDLPSDIILYVPTWRDNGVNPLTFLNLKRINDLLKETSYKFIIKLHPLTYETPKLSNFENLIILDDSQIEFTELLYFSKILITDYSSAAFDFSLLKRPILFYAPDYVDYENSRGLYESIQDVAENLFCKDFDCLYLMLDQIIKRKIDVMSQVNRIREKYNDFDDGQNCKRVLELIKKSILR